MTLDKKRKARNHITPFDGSSMLYCFAPTFSQALDSGKPVAGRSLSCFCKKCRDAASCGSQVDEEDKSELSCDNLNYCGKWVHRILVCTSEDNARHVTLNEQGNQLAQQIRFRCIERDYFIALRYDK